MVLVGMRARSTMSLPSSTFTSWPQPLVTSRPAVPRGPASEPLPQLPAGQVPPSCSCCTELGTWGWGSFVRRPRPAPPGHLWLRLQGTWGGEAPACLARVSPLAGHVPSGATRYGEVSPHPASASCRRRVNVPRCQLQPCQLLHNYFCLKFRPICYLQGVREPVKEEGGASEGSARGREAAAARPGQDWGCRQSLDLGRGAPTSPTVREVEPKHQAEVTQVSTPHPLCLPRDQGGAGGAHVRHQEDCQQSSFQVEE